MSNLRSRVQQRKNINRLISLKLLVIFMGYYLMKKDRECIGILFIIINMIGIMNMYGFVFMIFHIKEKEEYHYYYL